MDKHFTQFDLADCNYITVHQANMASVFTVLAAPEDTGDGRTAFQWVRFPNGDLVLGVFPQGDTYFSVERDAEYSGPLPESLWCETCGERPQIVRAKHAGLCAHCAAKAIDDLSECRPW